MFYGKSAAERFANNTPSKCKLLEDSAAAWKQIAPVLDEALQQLGKTDQEAIVLRFFERRDFRGVGEALGSNEDAAQKRVTRALEKLRQFLTRRGAAFSAPALGAVLANQAVTTAPAGTGCHHWQFSFNRHNNSNRILHPLQNYEHRKIQNSHRRRSHRSRGWRHLSSSNSNPSTG
jgi:hypothetical protein